MSELKQESTKNLLAEIEGDWESPKPGGAAPKAEKVPTEEELHAELDAAADRLVDSLGPPPVSTRNVEELDSGWGDDDEDDDDDADDEANEPELPDERLDPVAYAEAKKAREERIEARRERRRAKAEGKKARRKARVDAQKSKQKGKQRKARPPQVAARPERRAKAAPREASDELESEKDTDAGDDDDVAAASLPARTRAKAQPSAARGAATKPMLSKTNQWMLAVAVIVFIAAATFAAVVAR